MSDIFDERNHLFNSGPNYIIKSDIEVSCSIYFLRILDFFNL